MFAKYTVSCYKVFYTTPSPKGTSFGALSYMKWQGVERARGSVMSKSIKKLIDETRDQGYTELDLCDRGLSNITDIPNLSKRWICPVLVLWSFACFSLSTWPICPIPRISSALLKHLVRLTLSHNRITGKMTVYIVDLISLCAFIQHRKTEILLIPLLGCVVWQETMTLLLPS